MLWTQWLVGKKEIGFVVLVVLFQAGIIKPYDLGVLPFVLRTKRTLDWQIEVYAGDSSIFRMVVGPTVHWSENRALVRMVNSPTGR